MKRNIKNIIKISIGILILIILLYKINPIDYWNVLKNIKISWLLLAISILFFEFFLTTVNYLILLKSLNKKVDKKNLFRYVTFSWAIGNMSPGRLGEFGLVWLLKKKENIEGGEGFVITIIDKIVTIIALLSLASVGFYLYLSLMTFLTIVLIVFLLLTLSLMIIWKEKSRQIIKKYILRSYSKYFTGFSKSLRYILIKKKKYILLNLFVTYIKWGISFIGVYFLFLAFGFNFPYYLIVIIFSITKIISLIPISFAGLGIREGSGTFLLVLANVPIVIGANVYITQTVISYVLAFIFYSINHKFLNSTKNN